MGGHALRDLETMRFRTAVHLDAATLHDKSNARHLEYGMHFWSGRALAPQPEAAAPGAGRLQGRSDLALSLCLLCEKSMTRSTKNGLGKRVGGRQTRLPTLPRYKRADLPLRQFEIEDAET